MRRGDEPGGLDEALEPHVLPGRLGRRGREDETLAGDGILDGVA